MTTLQYKLVKIIAKANSHERYVTFQMAEERCRGSSPGKSCP